MRATRSKARPPNWPTFAPPQWQDFTPPLTGVEKQARGQSPEARAALRQENAKPIFDDLEEWLRDQLPKISGKSPLAKAIRYALGRMPKTRPYLDNGFLELDTDVVEQPLSQIFWVFGGFSRHASTIFA